MIKVLIVDDSTLIRRILTDVLNSDKNIEVVGTADNGLEAIEKIPLVKPDVITLDIEMPVMDGIKTLEIITKKYKIPVVMLSSLTAEGADLTFKALDIGAVDFIQKPKNIFNIGAKKENIINKIKIASKSNIISPSIKEKKCIRWNRNFSKGSFINDEEYNSIVVIGSSTGGPRALQEIIPKLPADIDGTILIVQHMPAGFTKSLADRLNTMSNIIVKEGEDGEKLKSGYCYIAPGNYHMTVEVKNKEEFISLNQNEPIHGLRPSVDITMKSVARINKVRKMGIVLTGMGSDGTRGITAIRKAGGFTIAQNEKTSVVYGMPKSAIASGNIIKILPLQDIADVIVEKMEV